MFVNFTKPTLQIQFTGTINTSVNATVYDVDMFDSSNELITQLHSKNKTVICYISAGSWENWRPDKDTFPQIIIGNNYDGWPGEKWLDIRRIDLLGPIMMARLDLAKRKNCDGIEPDNVDSYTANTGFPLTYQDQLRYNIWFANETHKRAMSVGLKNDQDQIQELLLHFDWALTEECYVQNWCSQLKPFISLNKTVFQVEYTDTYVSTNDFCPQAKQNGFVGILKHRNLDAWLQKCP